MKIKLKYAFIRIIPFFATIIYYFTYRSLQNPSYIPLIIYFTLTFCLNIFFVMTNQRKLVTTFFLSTITSIIIIFADVMFATTLILFGHSVLSLFTLILSIALLSADIIGFIVINIIHEIGVIKSKALQNEEVYNNLIKRINKVSLFLVGTFIFYIIIFINPEVSGEHLVFIGSFSLLFGLINTVMTSNFINSKEDYKYKIANMLVLLITISLILLYFIGFQRVIYYNPGLIQSIIKKYLTR